MPLLHAPRAQVDTETVAAVLRGNLREDPNIREPLAELVAHRVGF
jgi:hypothetical protein